MGSGGSGPYSGTGGGSQAYADSCHVVDKEISKDKKDSDIYNPKTGYFHNPTATKIQDAANGNAIYIDGKKSSRAALGKILPEKISSMNIYRAGSAEAIKYTGSKDKNVIIVELKK